MPQMLLTEALSNLYKRAMAFILRWEGGYSNHPNDPGGETNFGAEHKTN